MSLISKLITTEWQITIAFNWRDLWVGGYISKDKRTVFICPIPCIVIGIGYDVLKRCGGT